MAEVVVTGTFLNVRPCEPDEEEMKPLRSQTTTDLTRFDLEKTATEYVSDGMRWLKTPLPDEERSCAAAPADTTEARTSPGSPMSMTNTMSFATTSAPAISRGPTRDFEEDLGEEDMEHTYSMDALGRKFAGTDGRVKLADCPVCAQTPDRRVCDAKDLSSRELTDLGRKRADTGFSVSTAASSQDLMAPTASGMTQTASAMTATFSEGMDEKLRAFEDILANEPQPTVVVKGTFLDVKDGDTDEQPRMHRRNTTSDLRLMRKGSFDQGDGAAQPPVASMAAVVEEAKATEAGGDETLDAKSRQRLRRAERRRVHRQNAREAESAARQQQPQPRHKAQAPLRAQQSPKQAAAAETVPHPFAQAVSEPAMQAMPIMPPWMHTIPQSPLMAAAWANAAAAQAQQPAMWANMAAFVPAICPQPPFAAQAAPAPWLPEPAKKAVPEQSEELAQKVPPGGKTTVMLRNVPNNYTRTMLCELLDEEGFASCYDFVYLPTDFKTNSGLGFAFVNLTRTEHAERMKSTLTGFRKWSLPSAKVCEVGWSSGDQQGLAANVERYRNSSVMHQSVPEESKPMKLKNGKQVPFPGPTRKIWPPHESFGVRAKRA